MKTEFDAKLEVNKEEVKKHAKDSEDKVTFIGNQEQCYQISQIYPHWHNFIGPLQKQHLTAM